MKTKIKHCSDLEIERQLSAEIQAYLSESDEIVVLHDSGAAVFMHNTKDTNFVTCGDLQEINCYFNEIIAEQNND